MASRQLTSLVGIGSNADSFTWHVMSNMESLVGDGLRDQREKPVRQVVDLGQSRPYFDVGVWPCI